MKKTIFTGAGVAIVTPFNEDMSVNWEELGRLVDFQIENGTDAIISCGTTGEASTLTDDEHIGVIKYTVGADALLQVTPYYNKTSQAGLIKHFTTLADATDLPVVLYNVPSRTGMDIKPETYLALSEHPNIVAIKEANGNIASVAKTRSLCGDKLDIYSGNDDQIVPLLSLGGKGVISVLSNVMPRETRDICQLYFDGKTKESADLQIRLMDLIGVLFSDVNPIPVKEAVNLMGYKAGPCRLPLVGMSESGKADLIQVMKKYGLPVQD